MKIQIRKWSGRTGSNVTLKFREGDFNFLLSRVRKTEVLLTDYFEGERVLSFRLEQGEFACCVDEKK